MRMHTKRNILTMSSTTPKEDWPLPELTRARRAIVVVDVVESVRLMQEDEAGFIERWRRFRTRSRPISSAWRRTIRNAAVR